MHKTFTLRTTYLLFPLLFLVFFQLWGAIISTITSSFSTLLVTSFCLTLVTASTIAYHMRRSFSITRMQLAVITGISTIVTGLYSTRLNWNIFDYLCPTGLLGLVSQVANGTFPASFTSFPDFIMNYHQGFIFTAGVLSYTTGIMPSFAIFITLLTSYFLLNIYVPPFFISIKNPLYYLPPFLFVLVTSIDLHTLSGINFGWYNYISIFEYSGSNSWPLSLLLLTVGLFFIQQYRHTTENILIAAGLILATATLNATLFSVLILTVPLMYAYYWWATKKFPYRHFVLTTSLLILVFITPRFLPSAFLVGATYDTPGLGIRFLYEGFDKYSKHMARFIVLCGPLLLFSVFTVITMLRRKIIDWRIWLICMFVIAFAFPFVFGFPNVDVWDNLHKFAVITMYLGTVLLVIFFRDTRFSIKMVAGYVVVCAAISLPVLYDIATVRLSSDYAHQLYPLERIADITQYLRGTQKTIVPYKMDTYEICEPDQYGGIAGHSGNYLKDSYYVNFLLAPDIEQSYTEELTWVQSTSSISAKISSLDSNTVMVIKRSHETEFLLILEQNPTNTQRQVRYFKNFLLYE